MRCGPAVRPLAVCLALLLPAVAAAGSLVVEAAEGPILTLPAPEGAEWCLRWRHSVTGGDVADCFANDGGTMILRRSYLHDFAAGLGEVPGRGAARPAAGGGYWIDGIDEAIAGNALTLRVGQPRVGHRLTQGGESHDLSTRAAGRRVVLRLIP